jgi:8-oxo-dGTP pyrophosphatase MutT (NUDIX family)
VSAVDDVAVVPLAGLAARLVPGDWPWARENRALVEAHWTELTRNNPALFNGRVLVRRRQELREGRLILEYQETDFAVFIAFRDHGFPDPSTGNGFALAALRAQDGAFLLGRMGDHTANAGKIYFPAGTPDPGDVLPDGTVDLAGSVLRELAEETGLRADEVLASDNWTAVFAGARTALMREVLVPGTADAAREKIRAFLARDPAPELADVCIVRDAGDIDREAMPPFMQAYLREAFAQRL